MTDSVPHKPGAPGMEDQMGGSVVRLVAPQDAPSSPLQASFTPEQTALIAVAKEMILTTFQRFPPAEIGISFNGGKDSVVMFELIRSFVPAEVLRQCCTFVIDFHDEFEELKAFRTWYMRERAPELSLVHEEVSVDMRASLWKLTEKYPLKAVFMGTRQTDPHGRYQQSAVQMTTTGWPEFLRVCPIFSWTVCDVWAYTRAQHIDQCSLYEDGYTSLGKVSSTLRNPHLHKGDGTYKPAWELTSCDHERLGRDQS